MVSPSGTGVPRPSVPSHGIQLIPLPKAGALIKRSEVAG